MWIAIYKLSEMRKKMINETMTKEIEEIKTALAVIKLWLDDSDYKEIAEKVNTEYASYRINQARHQLNKALAE